MLPRIVLAGLLAGAAVLAAAPAASAAVCEGPVDTTCADGSRLCVAWVAGVCAVPYQTLGGGS